MEEEGLRSSRSLNVSMRSSQRLSRSVNKLRGEEETVMHKQSSTFFGVSLVTNPFTPARPSSLKARSVSQSCVQPAVIDEWL